MKCKHCQTIICIMELIENKGLVCYYCRQAKLMILLDEIKKRKDYDSLQVMKRFKHFRKNKKGG